MQYKFFMIPADGENLSFMEEELNSFLRGHRILSVQREFVSDGDRHCWYCCVEYVEGSRMRDDIRIPKEKVDYRNILGEKDFEKFRILRECRKILAQTDNIPAYAIFLDEHLAEMAKAEELTESVMKSVDGVGEKKLEKYGARFLALLKEKMDEASGKSVPENSGN